MSPLASLFAAIKQQNDADYAQHGHGMDPATFNSRLSALSNQFHGNGRPGGDNGGPIILGGEPMPAIFNTPEFLLMRQAPPTPSFRDPSMQAGPEPPVSPRLSALMGGAK